MVKIKMNTAIIGIIIGMALMLVAPFALAGGDKLNIESVNAFVNDKKDSGTIDVKPEDTLKLKIKVENLYDKSTADIEITDITVKATIKGIDDGEDLEEESDEFDLDAGDSDRVTIEFEIPLEVEADSFDLDIEVEGKDGNNTTLRHTTTYTETVRVKKEKHDVVIRKAELTNPTLKCSRTTSLSVNVMNMGTNEEDAVLKVINNELGLSKQASFELSEDPFDEDSKYSTIFTITVDKDQKAGIYPITVRVDYDDKTAEKTVELTVEDCEIKKAEEKKEEEVVVEKVEPETTTPVTVPEGAAEQVPKEEKLSFFEGPGLIALIVGADILILIIGIALIVGLARRK